MQQILEAYPDSDPDDAENDMVFNAPGEIGGDLTTYDTCFSSLNAYLADIIGSERSLLVLDGGANVTLPLYSQGTVLFPKTTISLNVRQDYFKAIVDRALSQVDAPRYIIGVIKGEYDSDTDSVIFENIGTTAEITEFSRLLDGSLGVKIRGLQRFRVKRHWIDEDETPCGEVQIIQEERPLRTPGAFQAFLPSWVYRMYDSYALAERLAEKWRHVMGLPCVNALAKKPDLLSFHVASLIPVRDSIRQELLEIDGISLRLQREIELLEKYHRVRVRALESGVRSSQVVTVEKQYGHKEGIEDAIVGKRRCQYEDDVRKNPRNYDSWYEYIKLEESVGNKDRIREVYERAIANVPPCEEKRYWDRYIYLWINYALYEEVDAGDMERTRDVYKECLKLIPHKKFSFAKIWIMAAHFEIRQLNLTGARMLLGKAIGMAPKDKIFKKYIEMELGLGNIDRCRKLYQKYIEWSPENCYAWCKFADLERTVGEIERARAIFELAIAQPALDMPEVLWKAYIDFEIAQLEFGKTRELYERLLDLTKHPKVWISYAKFEEFIVEEHTKDLKPEDDPTLIEQKKQSIQHARGVFERAINYYRASAPELKEERVVLLEEWKNMECRFGDVGDVSLVQAKMPKKLKKRRQMENEDGSSGVEEYIDYMFPEETQTTNLKILEAAYKWKKQKFAGGRD